MSLAAAVLVASLAATPSSGVTDAPALTDDTATGRQGGLLAQRVSSPTSMPGEQARVTYTLADAPTSQLVSFTASAATSLTGLVVLMSFIASPPEQSPADGVSWRARLATGLFLMSVGPSVGDLMNENLVSFLVGAVGRTVIAGLSWGAIELLAENAASSDLLLGTATVLLVGLGSLVWMGWGGIDLIRSIFAPGRWLERQNARVSSRVPIPEVRRAGGLRYAF